jgi:hypothetical protein
MSTNTIIIIATFFGFLALAAALLIPIYRFLQREQKVSEKWTEEELAKRMRKRQAATNGASTDGAEQPADDSSTDARGEAPEQDAPPNGSSGDGAGGGARGEGGEPPSGDAGATGDRS